MTLPVVLLSIIPPAELLFPMPPAVPFQSSRARVEYRGMGVFDAVESGRVV